MSTEVPAPAPDQTFDAKRSVPIGVAESVACHVRDEIEAMLRRVDELVASRASVTEIADAFSEPDLMITGEGEKGLYRNRAEFMPLLQAFAENPGRYERRFIDPILHSGDMAAAFVTEHFATPDGQGAGSDVRILYVFTKGASGWRVALEMYGAGNL